MTSERKIAANRQNGRQSSGPCSAAGKSIASRNAIRHGLSALVHRQSAPSAEIDQMARELCRGDQDLVILAQATKIATCEMTLRAIRAQKIAVIERMRERYAAPLCKKDNSLDLAKARSMEGWLADKELQSRLPKVLEKYKEKIVPVVKGEKTPSKLANYSCELPDWMNGIGEFAFGLVPLELKVLLEEEPETIDDRNLEVAQQAIEEPNQYEALEAAILDLVRIDRYERRAWSGRKRAVREFVKLLRQRHASSSATQHKAS